ncbi:MAG TPA: mannose-1-phosphate guanylyltransferase [Edaphocola sp.]|nr:mannose-1-phosphate guanylyltransferase [Edaphocola sp.]
MINVILSGGVGSRLWPLSRKSCPKQYIPIFDHQSLFQLCAQRNLEVCRSIIVVGNRNNQQLSKKNLAAIGINRYSEITEAIPRNTAAAIAFAAWQAQPEDILLITPSDHIIGNLPAYQNAIREAQDLAKEDFLVTFGISPTRPETGYGYIEHQDYEVLSFREKPNSDTARQMLRAGNFLWNSGMFCFKAKIFLEELKRHAPEVYAKAYIAWQHKAGSHLPEDLSRQIPSTSVDYAVMERSSRIKVVPATNLEWSDLGTFEALWEYMDARKPWHQKNQHLIIGTGKPVFFLGQENMVYVEADDAILILPRAKSQEVKELYEQLEKAQPELVN